MERRNLAQVLVPSGYVLLIVVVAIFAHSGLQGDHGLAAYNDAQAEARRLEADLAEMRAERIAFENKVRRLSEDFLDLDLLEERARDMLGLVREDEVVVH